MSLTALLDYTGIQPAWFAHGALICYVTGLLLRDGLGLRLFLLAGTSCYLLYYFTIGDVPLWDAIYASACIFVANVYAIFRSLMDRTTLLMSAQHKALYAHFPNLMPGQFRRMMRGATWHQADETMALCREGQVPDKLAFVQQGPVYLKRGEQITRIADQHFVGEISFLRGPGSLATATVAVGEGAKYVQWERARLYKLMADSVPMENALSALFNKDMSQKLERSWPHMPAPKSQGAPDIVRLEEVA